MRRPHLVFVAEREHVKGAQAAECRRVCDRIAGEVHGPHFQGLPDALAFSRVIVNEHKAVEREPQLLRQLHQVGGFVLPVDAHGGKVVATKQHPLMAVNDLEGILGVVLTVDGQQHAGHQLASHALQLDVGAALIADAQLKAVEAVLADDASQSVLSRSSTSTLRAPGERPHVAEYASASACVAAAVHGIRARVHILASCQAS